MISKKTICIPLFMSMYLLSSIKVNAVTIDREVNDVHKNWNIKFNQEVYFDDETQKAVKVIDEDGNSVNANITLKDSRELMVVCPAEGYKTGGTYTIDIGSKVHTKDLKYLKKPFRFVFKVASSTNIYKYKDMVDKEIDSVTDRILKNGIQTDWEAVAICKSGKKISKAYVGKVEQDIKKCKGVLDQPTDYERISTVLSLIGENPLNYEGYNLLEKIYNNEDIDGQGINAYAYALIALDSNDYKVPSSAIWTRDKLIKKILSSRTKDNGWDFAGIKADPDMTGMVLTALAPYKDRTEVKKAIDDAVKVLSKMQNGDATFSCYKLKNCESVAQVIIGLCSNGIDPINIQFTKGSKNLVDALMSFKTKDGGFSHTQKGRADLKATEQAILALEAYKSLKTDNGSIYKTR